MREERDYVVLLRDTFIFVPLSQPSESKWKELKCKTHYFV